MSQVLVSCEGIFTAFPQTISIPIPNLSSEAAFRLHRETMGVEIIMIANPAIVSTHMRNFMCIGTDVLPDNFVKYIGTCPFLEGGPIVHVIEVSA